MVCVHHRICTKFKMTNTSDVQIPMEIEGVSIATPSNITDSISDRTGGVPTTIEDTKEGLMLYTQAVVGWMKMSMKQ